MTFVFLKRIETTSSACIAFIFSFTHFIYRNSSNGTMMTFHLPQQDLLFIPRIGACVNWVEYHEEYFSYALQPETTFYWNNSTDAVLISRVSLNVVFVSLFIGKKGNWHNWHFLMKTIKTHLRWQSRGTKSIPCKMSAFSNYCHRFLIDQRNFGLGREIPNVTPIIELLQSHTP